MPAAHSKNRLQFSMRTLLILLTVACVVLAIPGGYILLLVLAVWGLMQAGITWLLFRFRKPIYRLLAGKPLKREPDGSQQVC